MTTFIIIFISILIIKIVISGKNKTKYKKYNQKKEYFYKDTFADLGKNNPNYNQENSYKFERKKTFEENRRKRTREHHINIEKKGKEYELFVANHFRNLGFKVKEHGLIHGREDSGIDVIAMRDKEITLIQCKNWKEDSKYKINHEKIKAFIGNTEEFLNKNRDKAAGYTIKRLYVTSNDILDSSARYFLRDSNLVEHMILPMRA